MSRHVSEQSKTAGLQDISRSQDKRFCSAVRAARWKHGVYALQKKPRYISLRKYNIALTSRKNLREQNEVFWR